MNTSNIPSQTAAQIQFSSPEFGSSDASLSSSFLNFDCPVPYELHMFILVLGLALFLSGHLNFSDRKKSEASPVREQN